MYFTTKEGVRVQFWLLGDDECSGLVKVTQKQEMQGENSHLQTADSHLQTADSYKVKYSKVNNNIVASARQSADDDEKKLTEFDMKCVDYMIQCIKSDLPGQRVPVSEAEKEKWAVHISRMQRIDNISQSDIWNTLVWTMKDSFWSTNIRSTGKFREKYSTLYLQSKRKKKTSFTDFENQRTYDWEEFEKEFVSN